MQNFIGLIHKDPDSDYGVSFPDFPGVATAGTDLDDARRMAEEALAFHVEGMIEDGEAIPEPSSLEAIMSDPGNSDAVAVLIPLRTPAKKAVRVNITLAEDLLRAIDAHAEAHGLTRSGFLARAAEQQMTSDNNPNNIRGYALSA
ncbi:MULTISPECIES: type II toxin-antitoxin system HicB family antitoxin [Rhizobium/Agrobacterium group]|jgi:predicted RNase H-like HicB family nuclease|uniref:type II toxin-antitoxin system HicB family antitoxin n=1 Tax=Rhizobium/Agrobacterium group TaxID=227290 RepID=UPI0006B88EB7|nr:MULTISPECIES: type II toxin-antitoxin system HicB family antitoxin [Rhizobium/Agrobacterium group]AOG11369.1 ribbon-helix-helix, copG family protein [Agrobacterium sp. RAC06]KPF59853.1 CopG family transcriptional regulator [Rhizobium sp. AAP116]